MKKRVLIVFLILIIGIVIMGYIVIRHNVSTEVTTNGDNIKISTYANVDKDKILIDSVSNGELLKDYSNKEIISDESEFIIIGTITSIDGGINYNPTAKIYTMIQTIGKIQVDKVIKGNIKEKEIPFVRLGGMVTVTEFEKGLRDELKQLYPEITKLTKEEKKNKYVSEIMEGDIPIEEGKTYLMYISYYKDFDRYSIRYLQYGLREIDKNTLSSNYKSVKVKDNTNGKFETLDSILPEKIKEGNR